MQLWWWALDTSIKKTFKNLNNHKLLNGSVHQALLTTGKYNVTVTLLNALKMVKLRYSLLQHSQSLLSSSEQWCHHLHFHRTHEILTHPHRRLRVFKDVIFLNIHIKVVEERLSLPNICLCVQAQFGFEKRRSESKRHPKIAFPSTSPAPTGNTSFVLMQY